MIKNGLIFNGETFEWSHTDEKIPCDDCDLSEVCDDYTEGCGAKFCYLFYMYSWQDEDEECCFHKVNKEQK